jgi:uncharacterized protein
MDNLISMLRNPWPWYIAGPMIGLTVPLLLILGNRNFGISSSLRHICAMCMPSAIPFFQYDWRKELWNLFFVSGIVAGALLASTVLSSDADTLIEPELKAELSKYGINDLSRLYPIELFNFHSLFSVKGFVLIVIGGFLVGFGTRYAGGCTSGHSITGISMLQLPSVIATICFMVGGIIVANLVLPYILAL